MHIVFELDVAPGVGLMDVTALTQIEAKPFAEALRQLGECKLHRIRSAPVASEDK